MSLLRHRVNRRKTHFHDRLFPVHNITAEAAGEAASGFADTLQGLKNLFSDPNKMAKQAQRLQNLLAVFEMMESESKRRQENIQGVKDAERKAPIRAALMSSLMSGGLEGFGSEFSALKNLYRPRTFQTTDAQGNQAISTEGPGGPVASPEKIAELDNFLEPDTFRSLREKGRAAAAAQTPESIFTPREGSLDQLGQTNIGRSAFVNNPQDQAEQDAAFQRAGSTGLTPEQEARFLPGRAGGGPVEAGQPYVVGERGPEVMVPSSSGTVLPNPEEDPEEHNRKQLKKVFQILSERGVGI